MTVRHLLNRRADTCSNWTARVITRLLVASVLYLPAVTQATAPAPGSRPAVPAAGNIAELGKVEVTGTKPLVELLQQMKTAIDAPFSNDSKHYDDMVCRIVDNDGYRAQGAVLDCGTQGYYSMRRGILRRDMKLNADVDTTSTATLGHPWHIVRLLNHEQLASLRKVLGKLPPPGKGDVEVLDDLTPAPAATSH